MKTILILMDSLNRHMLKTYNKNTWVKTPNIDRLGEKSVIFDNHWLGSAPCMPARRDIFTGRLNFLERRWGPVEPFDITLQECLRKHGIFTHITTDHTHYVEIGGENYIQMFNTWDIHRGQEFDPWVSRVNSPVLPGKYYGKASPQYELNRSKFKTEEDFSSPRTFKSAIEWLEDNEGADDYFMMVECFDPHEPFDCVSQYREMYEDDYDGPVFEWSSYDVVTEPQEAVESLRKRYAATLTMNDKWLGKLLDVFDMQNLWDDTMIIFTTDHGHLLGEHGWTGKNRMHAYNELSHLPLMIHLPGDEGGRRVDAITQNIDIMPTLLDYYGIEIPDSVRGFSLRKVLDGSEEKVRDAAIYGWHGKAVNITDGKYTYFRAPASEENWPCYNYCAMPTTLWNYMGKNCVDDIEMGRYLKYTNYPVYKIPTKQKHTKDGGLNGIEYVKNNELYDIENDYRQLSPLDDVKVEQELIHKLAELMNQADAPEEQFERLGIELK